MNPSNTTGHDGLTLYYGDVDNPHVLQVFIELREPGSKKMAGSLLGTIRKAADDGKFVVKFHFSAMIDDTVGGDGSRGALSAVGAASDVGQAQAIEYLGKLFASQPPITEDRFSDPSALLSIAGEVGGLRSPDFDQKVTDNTYADWAAIVTAEFATYGVPGAPMVWYDKSVILGLPPGEVTPEVFLARIESAA